MKNARNNGQKRVKNCLKWTASGLLLALLFVLVFAGTLSGAFGIENELQQNGIIQSNVASADSTHLHAGSSTGISINPTATTVNINPDVSKKSYAYDYDDADFVVNDDTTWTTGDGNNGGTWTIGKNENQGTQRYATAWFDYDLGENWDKFSDSIKINITGNLDCSSLNVNSSYISLSSGTSAFSNHSSDNAKTIYETAKGISTISSNCGSEGSSTVSVNLTITVSGRYVRIYFTTTGKSFPWPAYRKYGISKFTNVKVTLTRELKSYNISYSKNGINSSTTVANTSHKYMAASNIASDFYVGNGQYFTGWNTSANGSGIAMAIGASTGTSTAASDFGNVVKTNLQNGQTTTTLYAQYQGISFTFNGKDYTQYNNEVLQVLQGRGGYLTHTVDSSYSTVVSYRNSNGSEIAQPITIGVYSAIIEVSKDGKTRGTVTLPFEIIEGDFGKIQGGTGKWGSVTNPYVISNETHLKNLSAIVNGRDALNSIVGSDGVTAEQVVATDKTYKDCYFVVAANLGAGTAIELVPIGKDGTHYFAGTIFGGNDSDANNRTMRTINLNIQQSGVSNVGLFGYVKGATISHLTTAGTIVGGAAVGGLVGYADGVTISNCRNNATVTGAYMIGGLVGFGNDVTITSSVNNADITGEYNKAGTPSGLTKGAYVGGFVGVVNGGSIANCYNNGNISASGDNSDFLGGIAGYTTAPISYCASLKDKTIEGSNQVGGIVGKASGNNAKIEYCYFGGKINGLWNDNSAKLDFICAEKEDGSSVSNSWKLSSAIEGVTGNRQYANAGHSIQVASAFTLSPSYFDGTEYTPYTAVDGWQNILTVNINAFQILGETESGKFLALHDGSNKSTLPNKTVIGKEKNSTGSPAKTDLVVNFIVYYNADTKQDVVAELKDIKIDAAVDYNATEQYVVDNTQLPTTVNTHYFKQSFYFDQNGGGNATLGKTNAGTYKVYSDVWIRANNTDYLVGRKESTWAIKKLRFTIDNNQFFYGQDIENAIKNQIVIKNQSNVSVPKGAYTVVFGFNDTEHNFYGSIDIDQNQKEFSVAKTIISIYDSSNTLINDNFDINGFSVIVKAGDFGVQNNGINKSNIENNPWGSESNPYIIGTRGQLVTLSNIVRGVTNATNSQYTSDVYKYVKGTIASYGGAYFKLARSIASIGNITPIGTISNVFAATFDGNNNNLSGLNISVAGNNVGLFGYISGATIKNLTVNGSVKGSSNVGGVVGYALNSTIENVTNNASVSTHQSQSAFNVSYTIKQKDGTEGNSNEGWDKINDNNDSTKYCASNSKTSLSFIIDLGSPITAWGFAIFNGGDTNTYPDRRPNEIYIWGSNSNSNAAFPSDSVGKNNSGNTPSGNGLSDYWTSVYSQSGVIGTSVTTRYEIGFPSIQSYRYYWVYLKSYGQQIQFAEFDILHAGDSIGGVVGYSNGTNIKNATNNENIVGGNYSGGIVGQISASSTQYTITDSKNIGSISGNDGTAGIVGGIASGGYVKISACENSGNISGGENSNGVAGIIGHTKSGGANRLVVDGCKNTGTISGGRNVGGIGGRIETTRNNKDSIVFTNCYNDKNITAAKYGTVGGIVGYLYANGTTTVDVATISYCFSSGIMSTNATASSNVGGIVGNPNANSSKTSTRIFNCYTTNTTQGISGTNNATVDATNYVITSGTTAPTINNGGSYLLYDSFSSKPVVINNGTFTPFDSWADITKNDFNGFSVSGSVGKNQFFCSDNGSDTNTKYVKPSKTEGFAGDNGDVTAWYSATIESNIRVRVQNITLPTIGSKEYDGLAHGFGHTTYPNTANGAAANNPIVYTTEFLYVGTTYKENLNVSPTNVDVYNTTVTIKIDGQIVGVKKGDTVTITERLLKVSNVWTSASEHVAGDTSNVYIFHYNTQHQGIIENGISVASVHGEFAIPQDVYTIGGYVETKQAHNDTTHTRTFTLNDIRNYKIENKYSQYDDFSPNTVLTEDTSDRGISEATVGDTIVVTYTWKIVPYSLATNITSGNVWFGGRTDLIVGNQGIANVNVGNQSYADKRFYPLQSEQNGVQKVLVYAQHNYAADKFVLYVKYNNGTVAVLTQGTEYTLSALDAPTVENPTPLNTSVTASGKGNFDGDITKYYTAMFSDFGWKDGKTPEDNDWGGSADNPYVISKPEHLLRLSQIVNGGTAWNSIQNTVTAGVCIAPQTTAKATSRDYKDAYFLVTVDIDMSGYISTDGVYNFLPIGTRSTQNQTELPFSATFDGGDNTITYVYNVGSFYNVDGARKNYVGLFGYLNGATISNLKVASNGGLSITDNSGIVGIEYVGGIAGYAVDSTLYNSVLAYGGWVRGETYVGSIVGYGERITIVSSEAVSSANVGGETYVGGIVGKWIVSNQSQIGGSVAGQRYVTPADQIDVMGIKYVGGIAGWMDTSSCATTISYAPQLNNNGKDGNFIVVGGIEYVGALFGAFIGNGYHQNATNDKYTAIVIDKDASDKFKVGNVKVLLQKLNEKSASGNAKVVGGLVGYAEGVGILFNTDWTTSNVTLDTGNYTPSFIGGIAGVLGKNATIEAIYQLKNDGTFLTGGTHTITHSVPDEQKTFGTAAKPLGSFVGGIVGYVSSQAGVYWETGTTIFGNGISLVNSVTIYATSYAGGIFGALGDLSTSVASSFESDTDSILYKVLTTGVREGSASTTLGLAPTVDSNGITAKGRLVNNASISVSGSYVGGIAGYGGAKVRFVLRNTPQDSAIDVSKLNIYSGGSDIFINGSYAGGIAGYLVDNLEHDLQYIVVKARFNTNNQSATRVGGLVGYMGSGNVQNCVVTNGGSSAITASTDTYQGKEYVGGLVGETQNATIRNSVSTGFNLEKTSNTKGGLLGYGANPTIDSSWTFYIAKKRTNFAKNATPNGAYYATVSQSPYGKYILVDEGLINATESSYPTFASLCGFVGLLTNANVEGTLEFAVKVPNKTLNSNYENTQLAFYNASGSDTVTDNVDSFSKFENNNDTLTIALDMASGNSMQICVVGIEFVNVAKWNSSNPLYSVTDGATKNVENSYKKPSDSDSYSADVTNNNSGTVASNPTKIYDDEGNLRYIQAIVYFNGVIVGATVENKQQVGQYDSGELTPGSSATTPYTISNQQEWNDFAYSVYSGANNYSGKYVKLLTDSIVINTGNGGQHAGTKGTHNFGATVSIPSSGTGAPNNIGYNFAGDISKDSNVNNFRGTFDGNGHYITINYVSGGYYRVSAFPNAADATFRNLTIKGKIQAASQMTGANGIANSAAYDVAGFVGKPFGSLKFYNCTNEADIIGLRNVAGLVGYNSGGQSITFEACVNIGDITSLQGTYTISGKTDKHNWFDSIDSAYGTSNIGFNSGTGGIIGAYTGNITIESCRNAGAIIGGHNVGGIIGLHDGTASAKATLTIQNCANTGNVTSNSGYWGEDEGGVEGAASEGIRQNIFGYVGGLVGVTGQYSILKMYASYNTGDILTLSNIIGGLVGSVGVLYQPKQFGRYDNNVKTGGRSLIAYCYNIGNITAGGTFPKITEAWDIGRENYGGTISGGFVGLAGDLQISQGYNTGNITNYGHISYAFSWQVRAGGFIGQSEPVSESGYTGYVLFDNLYNVGTIYVKPIDYAIVTGHTVKNNLRYGAAISGYCDVSGRSNRIKSSDCYSINNCVSSLCAVQNGTDYAYYKNKQNSWNPEVRDQWYQNEGVAGIGKTQVELLETGRVYNTYDALTAAMDENSKLRMTGSNFAFDQSITALTLNYGSVGNYTSIKEQIIGADASISDNAVANLSSIGWKELPDSWLYVYGCLPQLSMFALDTQNGLSMRSVGYGQDDYGVYNDEGVAAGSEQYPYIIKDGVDLMGMQALVDAGLSFEGKYIEIANGSNNLEGIASTRIELATYDGTNTAAVNGANNTMYKAVDQNGDYKVGKSYHLLLQGAIFNKAYNQGQNPTYVGTDYAYWAWNTYYYNGETLSNVWESGSPNPNKWDAYGSMRHYGVFSLQNFIPMGRGNSVFKGNFSGKQANGEMTYIDNVRISTGKYNNSSNDTCGSEYGGLFSKVENAYIGYIAIGGNSKILSFAKENEVSATGGIVGLSLGSSVIDNCGVSGSTTIGAYGVSKTNQYVQNESIANDKKYAKDTYAGGIAGVADPIQGNSYNAGITLTIRNCSVSTSGIIESAKSNIGGVLGYVGGDAGASGKSNTVRIEGCSVDKAVIQAASSANTSSQIGGILGYGSQYVAAFITGCKVGVGGAVSIKGEHSLGGIAGGMSNAKGGYIDSCTVGANTTIERIAVGNDNTVLESPKHGTAIGGLVGFTQNSNDDTSPLTTTFSGTSAFGGTITVSVEATNKSQDSDAKISCIGGIVGDMGSGANFASGSNVTVGGNINITLASANVGGVVGRTNKATFIGKFNVAPNMSTENAENVGGFIGKNIGTVYILADTTDKLENTTVGALNGTSISIGGKIKGTSEVGGFIGVNNSGSTLNIGSNVANAKPYKSGKLEITITASVTGSGDNVGGIVGKNEGASSLGATDYATIDIVKGTIEQNGAIKGANNVGGIIGLNDGLLTTGGGEADTTIGGVTLSEEQQNEIKNLSINNTGSVTGTGDYVGGVVGKLDSPSALRTEDSGKGAIAGTFTNSGNVSGGKFVGGSLGYVGKYVNIATKGGVNTLFVNTGNVTAHSTFVGGSIGAIVGKITGAKVGTTVNFENQGTVNGLGYVGGSIGVLAGQTQFAQFVNSSKKDFTIDACNSVGGSVGYIGMPDALKAILDAYFEDKDPTYSDIDITVKNVHFEASGNLTANPTDATLAAAKDDGKGGVVDDNDWGGVGGAIGVLGRNQLATWENNTYYANGNVIAQNVNNVGGIIGLINANDITIGNLLAYNITVTGAKNVGGIVGATDGIGTVITSAYAIEGTFTGSKNVGGIIGLAKTDTDASTSYWVKGYANSDIATYDVKDLSKLGFTTGKAETGWFFLYANDANGANGLGTINTNHQGGGEIELKYWKRIANAYTAQERADGDDKKTIAPPSDIVSGGQPQHATLYATATAAEVTEKGYYMYTATSNNDVKPSVIYDNGVYYISVKTNVINAEDEKVQAQNVAVFYRSVSSSKEALIYNGYLRNAIIGLDGVDLYENPIGDNETPTINGYKGQYIFTATTTIKNADGSTSEVNEAQSDPNTYSSVIKIYYVDDNGTARLVGGNTELAWKITERELTVKFEKVTNRVYGTGADNSTDMTITISNIAPNRGKSVPIKITVAVDKEDIVVYTWNGTSFTGSNVGVKLAYLLEPNGTLSDEDKSSTSENITDENTYQLVARLFFTEAKSYTITVSDGSSGNTKARYVFKVNEGSAATEVSDNFTVIPAELKLVSSYATSSAYDGTYKGKEWLVTGFKYNDGILQFAEFGPSFNIKYKNGDVTTKAMTADNMTTGVDFNGPRVSVAGPSNGNLTISLANAINKGEYYLTFGKIAAGNYTLKIEDYLFSIVEIQIEISCDDNGKSKIYDGNAKDVKFTFKASAPAGVTFDGISEYKTFISKFFKINNQTIETNSLKLVDNKTITLTLQTEKDAATYKFVFGKGEKYDDHIKNCALKPATLPTYTYTITKRSITLSTTPTSTKTYIYNTEHQGLSQVKLNGESGDVGIVSGDTVMVKVSVPGGDPSSKTLSFDNQTLEVTAGISTIDANQYVASFDLDDASSKKNYTLSATNVSWKIDKYKIMIGEFEIGAEKTYNAEAEVPKINVTNSEVSVSGNTFTYGTDTFTLEYAVSYNNQTYASNNLVNAGTYKIKIGTSNGKIHAKHSDGNDASNNYEFGNSSTEHQYVINPCEIKIGWEKKTFVYNASNWKLNVASIEINNKTKTVTNNRVQTGLGNDTLTFSRGGGGIDVGSYTTEVTSHSVSVSVEPIHGVRPIAGNYKIVSGATSDKFSITPSKLKIFYAGGTTSKVYDAGFGISGKPFVFNTQSQNGGAHGTSDLFTISYVYTDKNVGNDKEVVFTYVLKQNANYEYVGTGSESKNVGQITPAHIKVALDKLRSGKATRTFTNEPYYGGKDGASGGKNDGKSTVYRSGEGFRISGVFGNDDIKVVAKYAEAGDDRAMFDKYVNDIVKNADETFAKAAAGTHLKMLVFEMTGGDATNYTFNVYDTSDKAYSKNNGDSQTPVNVYDKDDEKNNKDKLSQIKIEITVKTYKVEYTNTAQSYANADNTYNTNWERVGVSNNPPGVTVTVSNGWMYADGQDHSDDEQAEKKVYKAYTTIRGSQNSVRLGAKISGIDGMELNYKMVNQPILTIGYFVVDNNDVFEIGSASSLMIASYYWWVAQNGQNPDFNLPLVATSTWHTVVSNYDYINTPFAKPSDAPSNVDMTGWDWDMYFAWFEQQYNVKIFLNETGIPNEDGTWGYYTTGEESQKKQYTKYRMVRDFSGKLSESDIAILETFFPQDKGWGVGKTYLDNFLNTSVGSVLTAVGSVFRWYNGSVGQFEFDGNGYVIEYLNIMGYGKDNVGLFDVIGANGIVKNLHLRNVTINGNAKYVGGIAGKVLAAADALTEKSVKNVSFHGSINVTGSTDQSVGGLFGISERAVENSIVLGSITVSNVNAKVGGVVGSSEQGMSNVVSLMQIDANCNVGAFSQTNTNLTNSYHLQNAVWRRNGSSITFVNHANAKTYDELMSGSVSGYGTTNKYYHESETSVTKGEYDVLDDVVLTKISVDNKENARQSMRLADIVKVYLLMYSLNETQATDSGNLNGANVYAISTSSWLVGTADGTSENAIFIANKQNVSLLRELRFASFTLKANVSIEIASTFSGAFYGSVNAGAYKITCDKAMFEAYTNDASAWLSVQQ